MLIVGQVDGMAAPLNIAPVVLTADLIDYRVRRRVVEFLVAQEIKERLDSRKNSFVTQGAVEALPFVPEI